MENQRKCTTCQIIKPYSDFNWDKRFNIPFSRCKPCYNEKCKEYRKSKEAKEVYKKWTRSESGKKSIYNAMAKWRFMNSMKRKAHTKVSNALRDGRLFKMPCVKCNNPITEAHHTSYEEKDWLNVIWLCKEHHVEETYSSFI